MVPCTTFPPTIYNFACFEIVIANIYFIEVVCSWAIQAKTVGAVWMDISFFQFWIFPISKRFCYIFKYLGIHGLIKTYISLGLMKKCVFNTSLVFLFLSIFCSGHLPIVSFVFQQSCFSYELQHMDQPDPNQ